MEVNGRFIPSLNLLHRIQIFLFGYAYIGDLCAAGWRAYNPMYVVRCDRHGFVVTYEHKWGYIDCPLCMTDQRMREKKRDDETLSRPSATTLGVD